MTKKGSKEINLIGLLLQTRQAKQGYACNLFIFNFHFAEAHEHS